MGTAMRPAYTIDLEHGCIFLKWSGVMTAHGVIDFNRDLVQDPDYRLGLNRLIDLRRADFGATSGEVEEMGGGNHRFARCQRRPPQVGLPGRP